MIKYRGKSYEAIERKGAAPAATIDDSYWRTSSLKFWIYAICDSRTGSDLPAKAKAIRAKRLQQLPKEAQRALAADAETLQRVLDACAKGTCQYIALEGVGWEPGQRRGAKGVEAAQRTLEWIEQFRSRSIVSGSQLIWARIEDDRKLRSR